MHARAVTSQECLPTAAGTVIFIKAGKEALEVETTRQDFRSLDRKLILCLRKRIEHTGIKNRENSGDSSSAYPLVASEGEITLGTGSEDSVTRGGNDSCNQYLLLKCRKGLVSHSETILTP